MSTSVSLGRQRAWASGSVWFAGQFLDPASHPTLALGPLPVESAVPPVPHETLLVDEVHAGPDAIGPGVPIFALLDGGGLLPILAGYSGRRTRTQSKAEVQVAEWAESPENFEAKPPWHPRFTPLPSLFTLFLSNHEPLPIYTLR